MTLNLPTPTERPLTIAARRPDQHPALVYLASLAPGSKPTMVDALNKIAALVTNDQQDLVSFPWAQLRYEHTQAIRALLAERYAAATANKMLAALRRVLKEAWRLKQITADDYAAAVDIKTIKGSKPDAATGRALHGGELRSLLQLCLQDEGPAGIRDAAIISIAYACGLRRAEIVGLDLSHVDREQAALTILGKGNKTRVVPIDRDGGAWDALMDWIEKRGSVPGPLFLRVLKNNAIKFDRLTPQTVYYIYSQRGNAAGIKKFSPHDLRRTFAGDLLDEGTDLVTVQKLMGHSNPATTAGYDRRGERAKRDAVRRLHVPYRRKK
jgi:site-specific recombinase XerD